VGTRLNADGLGRSRKEAEQSAAAEAVQSLQDLEPSINSSNDASH
jgi:dsRNA-specific ribonuclease